MLKNGPAEGWAVFYEWVLPWPRWCPAPHQAHCDQVPAVALIPPAAPGTLSVSSPLARSLLALIRLTAHAKNVQVGAEEMENP